MSCRGGRYLTELKACRAGVRLREGRVDEHGDDLGLPAGYVREDAAQQVDVVALPGRFLQRLAD